MNDVERLTLRTIGENVSSPDVFTDDSVGMAQIRGSINDAIEDLSLATGSYTKTYHLSSLTDRQFYRIDARHDHFVYAVEVWDRNRHKKLEQKDLLWVAQQDPHFMKTSGDPDFYGQIGTRYLWLYPYPGGGGYVYEIKAVCIPKRYVTDTDEVKVRDNYRRALSNYAVSEYYASRGNAERATEHLGKYLELAGMMRLDPRYQADRIHQAQMSQRSRRQ